MLEVAQCAGENHVPLYYWTLKYILPKSVESDLVDVLLMSWGWWSSGLVPCLKKLLYYLHRDCCFPKKSPQAPSKKKKKKKKKDKYSRVEPSASQMLIDFVFFWLINPSLFDKKFVTSSDETRNKLQGRYFWFYLYSIVWPNMLCIQSDRALTTSTMSPTKAHRVLMLCIHEWLLL